MEPLNAKQSERVLTALAELVAWYGVEGNAAYVKRLDKARRLIRQLEPDLLKAEQEKAQAINE